MPIIDASVYVALARESDPHHEDARTWFETSVRGGAFLAAPTLFVVEVGAAIRRLTGAEEPAERVVSEMIADGLVELFPLSLARTEAAVRVAMKSGLRGADAVYLALAKELDEPLVSLDAEHLGRGAQIASVERP